MINSLEIDNTPSLIQLYLSSIHEIRDKFNYLKIGTIISRYVQIFEYTVCQFGVLYLFHSGWPLLGHFVNTLHSLKKSFPVP